MNTPLCRQASAIHSAWRPVQPNGSSAASRPRRCAIIAGLLRDQGTVGLEVGDEDTHRVVDDELGGDDGEEGEPERDRPPLPQGLLPLPEVDQVEVGGRAVRSLRCGVDAEHDLLDLEFGVGGAGRHGGDLGAVARERRVRQLGREEPEAPRPVLLDRRLAPGVEVGDEPVQEILGRGIERIRLRRCGLVGHGLGAADLVDPHDDRAGRLDGRDPEQEHAER